MNLRNGLAILAIASAWNGCATPPDPLAHATVDIMNCFERPLPEPQRRRLAEDRLAKLVQSHSTDDRLDAAYLNSTFGHVLDRPAVLANLRVLLADREATVRRDALYSCIGCEGLWGLALPALPQVAALVSDPDPEVRRAAVDVRASLREQKAANGGGR